MKTKDKIEEDIENTVESEKLYQKYIEDKNQKRTTSSDSLNYKYNIGRYKGRVKKVFFSEKDEKFTLSIIDFRGRTRDFNLEAGKPDDKSSEWVRLCEWKNINPRNPSELHNEEVPIVRNGSDFEISVPPIQKKLNPMKYKYSRSKMKLSKYIDRKSDLRIWKEALALCIITSMSVIMVSILVLLIDPFTSIKQITNIYDFALLIGYPILLMTNVIVNITNIVFLFAFMKTVLCSLKSKTISYLFPDQ